MKRKRRRLSKKKLDQLEREEAEKESKARSESEKRQERIKVLWETITSGELAHDAKELADNELIRSLIELAQKQKCEIEYLGEFRCELELIRAHYPEQLENLSIASFRAAWEPLFEKLLAKQKPTETWEYKRRGYTLPGGVGLIEYQFGGAGEAEWRKQALAGLLGLPYQPTCLDEIFAGGAVKVHDSEGEMVLLPQPHRILKPGLQRLFGRHRNRFSKNLPTPPYDFRAVTKIMQALLRECPPNRKTPARGAPRRLWPRVDLRQRVLSGIAVRINSLAISREIAREFMNVVRQYLPDSAKK